MKQPTSYPLTAAQIDAYKQANLKAEGIYATANLGRDDQDPVFAQFTLMWKSVPFSMEPKISEIDDNPQPRQFILTRNTIAVIDSLSIRNVVSGIDLVELAGNSDDPTAGQCCTGINQISGMTFNVKKTGRPFKAFCFTLQGGFESWILCHADQINLYDIRNKILMGAIKASLRKKGILNVNVLLPSGDNEGDWTWNAQEEWAGLCKDGAAQSPIDIDTGRAESIAYMSLQFHFIDVLKPTVQFNGHEVEIFGDFGKVKHKLEVGVVDYMVYKVGFRFKSEHTYFGKQYPGELLVYMMSKDGKYSIMSFFLAENPDAKINYFFSNLRYEQFTFASKDPIEINYEKKPTASASAQNPSELNYINLNQLIVVENKGGDVNTKRPLFFFNDIFRRSFAWYTGSFSTPPCKEDVRRFVFEQPVYIPTSQLNAIKSKVFLDLEVSGNARKARPQGTRKVYTHQDNGKKCAIEEDSLITEEKSWNKNEVKVKSMTVNLQPTYLKASSISTTYGVIFNNFSIPE